MDKFTSYKKYLEKLSDAELEKELQTRKESEQKWHSNGGADTASFFGMSSNKSSDYWMITFCEQELVRRGLLKK